MSNDDLITVRNRDGELGTLKKSDLKFALNDGFSIPSEDEIERHNKVQDAKDPLTQGIAAAEKFGSSLSFGLTREAENALGITTPEEQSIRAQAIEEDSPFISAAATGLGVVAPLLATGGGSAVAKAGLGAADILNPVGAVAKIGTGITEAALPGVAKVTAGLAETSPRIANIINRGTAGAVGGAAEGALFGVGQSIDEHALGDPEALGEHLISNVGVNALLGGGMGGLFHGISGGIEKNVIPNGFISQADRAPIDAGDFRASVQNSSLPDKEGIFASLSKRKDNADEILQIGQNRGYPVLEGQISASKAVQHAEDALLSGQPTFASVGRQELATKGFNMAAKDVENVLNVGADDLSATSLGGKIQESLTSKIDQQIKPINELYDAIKEYHEIIPTSERALKQVANNIEKLQEVRISGKSPVANIANGIIDDLKDGRLKTVDDLRARRIQLSQSVSPTASGAEKNITGILVDKLKDLEQASIERFANTMKTGVAKDRITSLLDQVKDANSKYKDFIIDAKQLGEGLGKKNIGGAQGLKDFIEGLNPQKLADKIFTDKNVEFAQFMKAKFPQEFEQVRKLKIGELKDKYSKKGYLDVKAFSKGLNDLEPETKNLLFNKQDLSIISDANKYLSSFPESFNPSKTAYANAYMNAFTDGAKSMGLANARDFALKKFIEKSVGMTKEQSAKSGTMGVISKVIEKANRQIETTAKAVFSDKGQAAFIGLGISLDKKEQKETEKTMEKIQEITSDPEKLMNALDTNTKELYQFAPATTQAAQKAMIAQFKYLSSKIPKPKNQKILSPKYVPAKSQIMKFNGYLNTVKQPASVMRGIKHGMVTSDQMETLKVLYPQMLQQMQMAVMEQLSDHLSNDKDLPYKTKLGLSQFLERPLDNSMTQESIAMNQMNSQGVMQNDEDGMIKPTSKGMASLSEDSRTQTGLQKLQQGEEA